MYSTVDTRRRQIGRRDDVIVTIQIERSFFFEALRLMLYNPIFPTLYPCIENGQLNLNSALIL